MIDKLKKIPKPLISSIAYMIVVFFQSGVNLLTTPIFSRMLSTDEFGITSTYQSWYNILSIFITLNIYAGVYNNSLIDFNNDRKQVTSSFLSISIFMSIFSYSIFLLFKENICKILGLDEWLIHYMFLNFLTYPAWGLFLAQQKFDYKYIKPLLITIITFILNPVLGIIGIKYTNISNATIKVIACGLPSLIVNFMLLIIILKEGKCFYNKKYWKYALSFNIPLIPHYLSNMILAQSDRIMIQRLISFSAAGIYAVSYNLSQVLQGVYVGINAAWIPFTYKSLKKEKYDDIKKYSNYLIFIIAFISGLLVLFSPEIIKVLAFKEYYDAVWIIPPIVLGLYFSFLTSLFANIEFYYKKNIFVTIGTTFAAILNVVLNLLFIPKYGFVAAGYTTAIGYFVLAIAHYIFMKKIQPQKIYDSKFILYLSGILIFIIIIITFLYKYIYLRYSIFLIILLYCCLNHKKVLKYVSSIIRGMKGEK